MLGHSNVGKTTYMASMYGALQKPINGFSLRTQNATHHRELMQMYDRILAGRYPLPSQQRQQYDFSLHYQNKAFFPFQWIDYRGGALDERSDNIETQRLSRDLKEADGIMIFCDSDPRQRKKIHRQ